MFELYLTEQELEKGLTALKKAKARGFGASEAIFELVKYESKKSGVVRKCGFSDQLILKAHPTNAHQDWGRINIDMIQWYKLVDGQCKDV